MARDYVGYLTPDYVRGTITDHITFAFNGVATFCHMYGETQLVDRDGCHVRCFKCGAVSEGCGD